MPEVQVTVPDAEFLVSAPATMASEVYPWFGEERVARLHTHRDERGFETTIEVFRRTEDGGFEQVGRTDVRRSPTAVGAAGDRDVLSGTAGVSHWFPVGAPERAAATAQPADPVPAPTPTDRARAAPGGEPGPGPHPFQRAGTAGPAGPGQDDLLARLADRWDEQVGQAERATAVLQADLESYVDEGGNWFLAGLGATALDVAGHAMSFTQGLADTGRFGQGLAEGSWSGAQEDLGRLLNVLPGGRITTVLDIGLNVSSAVTAAGQGAQPWGAAGAAALAAITATFKAKGKWKGGRPTKPKKLDSKHPLYPQDHHIFPREFEQAFVDAGIDIHAFTVTVPMKQHLSVIHKKWNGDWEKFFLKNGPWPGRAKIFEQAARMMEEHGLTELHQHQWRSGSGVWEALRW